MELGVVDELSGYTVTLGVSYVFEHLAFAS